MQEQQRKQDLPVLLIIIVSAVIGTVGYLIYDAYKPADITIDRAFEWKYDSLQSEIGLLKLTADQKNDTIQQLKVELGQVGIELNRSRAKITDLTRRVLKANTGTQKIGDPVVWTEKIAGKMQDCDSLAYELHFAYLDKAAARQSLIDSLNTFYEILLANKDSTIEVYSKLDTLTFTKLIEAEEQRDKAKAERDKAKKRSGIGWIAAAVAAGIAILSNIF